MRPFERFLVGLDSWPWSAFVRLLIGLCSSPVARTLHGGSRSVWLFPAFFVASLIALRVVPAVIRFALPFSRQANEVWAGRRALAKRYDSYQWQKLIWIGLGLVPYVANVGEAQIGEVLVAAFCLIGGSAGLLIWSRVNAAPSP